MPQSVINVNNKNNSKLYYLLRHGRTEDTDSLQDRPVFRGRTDTPLTREGWQQMQQVTEALDIQQVFSSSLRRCAAFAQHYSNKKQIPCYIEPALQELDFGQWDGRAIDEIQQTEAQALYDFWSDPLSYAPPEGETLADFNQRVIECWQKIIQKEVVQNSLLVIHGGVQKVILAHILEMPLTAIHNIEVPYACCSAIKVYYNGDETKATLKQHGQPV